MEKVAIIGGPCSGKTTVIKELEKQGFNVIHETARNLIEEQRRLDTDMLPEEGKGMLEHILHNKGGLNSQRKGGFPDRGSYGFRGDKPFPQIQGCLRKFRPRESHLYIFFPFLNYLSGLVAQLGGGLF